MLTWKAPLAGLALAVAAASPALAQPVCGVTTAGAFGCSEDGTGIAVPMNGLMDGQIDNSDMMSAALGLALVLTQDGAPAAPEAPEMPGPLGPAPLPPGFNPEVVSPIPVPVNPDPVFPGPVVPTVPGVFTPGS